METQTGIIVGAIIVLLACAIVLYDWLHDKAGDWCEAHHCQWRVPPWWVRFDRWIYHCTYCRVQNVVHEHHVWLGGRLTFVGAAVSFINSEVAK